MFLRCRGREAGCDRRRNRSRALQEQRSWAELCLACAQVIAASRLAKSVGRAAGLNSQPASALDTDLLLFYERLSPRHSNISTSLPRRQEQRRGSVLTACVLVWRSLTRAKEAQGRFARSNVRKSLREVDISLEQSLESYVSNGCVEYEDVEMEDGDDGDSLETWL